MKREEVSERVWSHLLIPEAKDPLVGKPTCPVGVLKEGEIVTCGCPLSEESIIVIETDFFFGAEFRVYRCGSCKRFVFPVGLKWGSVWPEIPQFYDGWGTDTRCPFCGKCHDRTVGTSFPIKTKRGTKEGVFCPRCHKLAFIREW